MLSKKENSVVKICRKRSKNVYNESSHVNYSSLLDFKMNHEKFFIRHFITLNLFNLLLGQLFSRSLFYARHAVHCVKTKSRVIGSMLKFVCCPIMSSRIMKQNPIGSEFSCSKTEAGYLTVPLINCLRSRCAANAQASK